MCINHGICLSLVFALLAGCATHQVRSGDELLLTETRQRIERGEFKIAINSMESFVRDHEKHPQAGLAHYLAGIAARGYVDEMRRQRGFSKARSLFSTDFFLTEDGAYLEKAYMHFVSAGKLFKKDDLAAESIFMAGAVNDVEYMKRFPDALKHYQQVYEQYPGTQWAGKARERYIHLQQYFKGITGSPHNLESR